MVCIKFSDSKVFETSNVTEKGSFKGSVSIYVQSALGEERIILLLCEFVFP